MEIHKNYSLKGKNTFGIDAKAKFFIAPNTLNELVQVILDKSLLNEVRLIIGGGSNLLFINDFDGVVIHPDLDGKEVISEDDNDALVKANAAEDWDKFVEWTVNMNFCGLENLSLIPGSVGACPVQNIGAYGVEVADVIEKIEALETATGKLKEFSKDECLFDYRNSIFKNTFKGKFIITSVYFRLSKKAVFKTHYGAVEEELKSMDEINLRNIRQAIINIRKSKLPDPEKTPNAGSFFKNPVVTKEQLEKIRIEYPEVVSYKVDENNFKLAAGWMIDKLGWKGKSHGGAAVHSKQALVLVNKNNATGKEVLELANSIKDSVYRTFNVNLECEVNIVG